ncbi:MAG: alginate export family protein, partial [Candidatus Omnitrophica bacterium]|nr:alginate export family protein [Candidatus Omnitrophota bacterium]
GNADVSYTFQNPMQPKVGAAWFYASGDSSASEEQWVPLYPDNLGDRIGRILYAYSVNTGLPDTTGSNLSVPKIYASLKPAEKHTLSLAWFPASTIADVSSPDSDELGYELNLGYAYQYTEDVSFGLLLDYAVAGKAIVPTGSLNDDTALQVIGTVAVSF